MRIKKHLLLYCADIDFLSTTAFALRLHGYEVAAVKDLRNAVAMIEGAQSAFQCAVLIHARQADPTGRLSYMLLQCGFNLPILLIDRVGDLAPVRYIDTVLYGHNTAMVHVLAALQALLSARLIEDTRRC